MSASETSREDRQLPASARRIQQARDQGQLARSRELVHFAAALAGLALFVGAGPLIGQQALEIVGGALRFDRNAAFETATLPQRLSFFGLQGLAVVLPVAAALGLLLGATSIAVGGWNFTMQALEPKFERLSPLAGLQRLWGWRHLLGHLRLVAVATALVGCAGYYLSQHGREIDTLARLPLHQGVVAGFEWLAAGLALLAAVCFGSALADVPLQIFNHAAELRMTREEAQREHKEDEGDPHLKGERRRRAREMSRGRMLADVPTAHVVVTNPTHYAVALRYDEATMNAPRIVALGADHLALKIREVAAASGVPLLEAPPLARALYRHGEVGGEVPVALYTAVAQVLAWVMRLRSALRPPAAPEIELPPGLDPQETPR